MNLSRAHFIAPDIAPIGLSDQAFRRHWLLRECHVEEEKSHEHHRCLRHQSGGCRFPRQHVRVCREQQQPAHQVAVLARNFGFVVCWAVGGRGPFDRIARCHQSVSPHRVASLGCTSLDRTPAVAADHDHNFNADDHNGGSHNYHRRPHDDGGEDNDRCTYNGRIDHDGCSNHNDRSVYNDRRGHDHHGCPHDDACANYHHRCAHDHNHGARRVETASHPTWLGHERGRSGRPEREAYRCVAF
jgi:hypothetical protein